MAVVKLGLIGDNITRSQSPRLHVLAGKLCGIEVSYERLIPALLGLDFDAVLDSCVREGYRGINITYPYKEVVVHRVAVPDPLTERMRACNTVVFGDQRPLGYNTDFSGFVSAYRAAFGDGSPGKVAVAGAGGVGKAIAFALTRLGATELRFFDQDRHKAEDLARVLSDPDLPMHVTTAPSIAVAADGADGLVNCTPLGMSGYPGTAIDLEHMRTAKWAFDAVYTPVETEFLKLASDTGLSVMSGWELFFHQGVHAFRLFTGEDVDVAELRRALETSDEKLYA
ncbi:shikimate dehydrogenase family protein [Aquibium oceanicum]|uniref:Shikimate dehydrogenase n=1 Tax=Aquibium oceanicum TaxID=1670800 RepID=A0A1L3SLH1_9HYPH|nr:shikimate dehydrogenase [Aquibium oceanicum]APH70211.1 shikimate dehydrogenase [Aquibium oceanicum]